MPNHRFVTPIFLHAGLIHFIFNMLAQVTAAGQVCFDFSVLAFVVSSPRSQIEREMGSAGFIITYIAAGIFGYVSPSQTWVVDEVDERTQSNVLGGNFARPGIPSVGASGAIFGMFAVSEPFDLKPLAGPLNICCL